ncbi:MAG: LysM peptidoglycan-binding domain-containing protein [Lachnospira sp.]|nr:LysM peptidoglycan-binding domain-containing protein [Lachnospira sp.]
MNQLDRNHSVHYNTNRRAVSSTRNQRRRQKKIQKFYRSLFVFAMAILIVIGIGRIVTVDASDQGHTKENQIRYYTSISIDSEETLWNIAQEYNNGDESNTHYINSIMNLNNMNSDTLYSGQNLLVYYYSTEVK